MDGYMECYLTLANAIVMQAVQDYRLLCKQYKMRPDDKLLEAEINKCRKFFNSGWFNTLSGADGEAIAELIERHPEFVIKKQFLNIGAGRRGNLGQKRKRHAG